MLLGYGVAMGKQGWTKRTKVTTARWGKCSKCGVEIVHDDDYDVVSEGYAFTLDVKRGTSPVECCDCRNFRMKKNYMRRIRKALTLGCITHVEFGHKFSVQVLYVKMSDKALGGKSGSCRILANGDSMIIEPDCAHEED